MSAAGLVLFVIACVFAAYTLACQVATKRHLARARARQSQCRRFGHDLPAPDHRHEITATIAVCPRCRQVVVTRNFTFKKAS